MQQTLWLVIQPINHFFHNPKNGALGQKNFLSDFEKITGKNVQRLHIFAIWHHNYQVSLIGLQQQLEQLHCQNSASIIRDHNSFEGPQKNYEVIIIACYF